MRKTFHSNRLPAKSRTGSGEEPKSSRIAEIVERLRVRPDESILEIGCGHGVAADLICQRLAGGTLVAIDRSAKMIVAAKRRNAHHVVAGKAEFHVAALEKFDPGERRFDAALAIRVGLFHREPERARSLVKRWLKPGARVIAVFDEPARERVQDDPIRHSG